MIAAARMPRREHASGSTMQLSYSLRRDEFMTAVEAVVGSACATEMHRGWVRRLRLVPYVDFGVLVLAGVVVLMVEPQAWRGLAMFWIVLLLTKAAIGWYVERTQTAQLGVSYDPRRHDDVVATFDADSVSHVGPEHRQTWNWTLLRRLHERPKVYVLEFAGFDMLAVPERAFATGEEAKAWASGIRARLAAETGAG
jgi:hypothetical protein